MAPSGRRACRARKDLVSHRVGVANQLREHLKRVFPGAVGLFAELDSPISLAFLARFDCQDRAGWLSPRRMAAWLAPREVPADTVFAMRLCLEEALANIAMHGDSRREVSVGAALAEEAGRLVGPGPVGGADRAEAAAWVALARAMMNLDEFVTRE